MTHALNPTQAEVKRRYLEYLDSPEFTPHLKRLAGWPLGRLVIAFVAFMTTVGIPVTVYQLFKALGHRKRYRTHLIEVGERSVPLMTYGLMVNSALRERPGVVAPGLVIGSFDPEANRTSEFLSDLALELMEMSLEEPKTPDEEAVAALFADLTYRPHRRRALPKGLTQGREVYAFDLMFVGDYFPGGTVDIPLVPCMAEPGPEGEIHMIPCGLAAGAVQAAPPSQGAGG